MLSNCDLCGNADKFLAVHGDPSGKISICGRCGFVLVRERRSLAEVAAAWSDIYKNGGYDPEWPGVKARLFYVAEWLDQTIGLRGESVLDIGAGNGQFMEYVRQRGGHPVGIDPDGDNVAKMRADGFHAFQIFAQDEEEPPDQQPYFNLVTLNWTLENTAGCLAVLRYAKRCLAPGGHVVVSTGSRILVPFKKPLSIYLPQDADYPHDTHCYRWSQQSLARALIICGFTLVRTNDYGVRDEMILCGIVDSQKDSERYFDAPQAVQNHFANWQTCFP